MYHFFALILHRFFVDFLLISNPSKPSKSRSRAGGSTIFTKSMFSLRVQKSIQKPSKFGFKNPWKFEHHLCQLKVNMLHFWSQKAIKMRSKILENQVRSDQLSSGHVFGQRATSRRSVWKGRGTKRYSRMCPPPNGRSSHLIEAAKRGRLDQMIFFSAPLTTRAPPTTVRPDDRPNARWNL